MSDFNLPDGMRPILLGVVGSRLYGLDHVDSDTDRHGIHQVDTREILSLDKVKPSWRDPTQDTTLFELGRFFELASQSDITALELLWLPEYEILSTAGSLLVTNRYVFPAQRPLAARSIGFAKGKIKEIEGGKATPKQVWHTVRMLDTSARFLATGEYVPHVGEKRGFYLSLAKLTPADTIAIIRQRMAFVEMAAKNSPP